MGCNSPKVSLANVTTRPRITFNDQRPRPYPRMTQEDRRTLIGIFSRRGEPIPAVVAVEDHLVVEDEATEAQPDLISLSPTKTIIVEGNPSPEEKVKDQGSFHDELLLAFSSCTTDPFACRSSESEGSTSKNILSAAPQRPPRKVELFEPSSRIVDTLFHKNFIEAGEEIDDLIKLDEEAGSQGSKIPNGEIGCSIPENQKMEPTEESKIVTAEQLLFSASALERFFLQNDTNPQETAILDQDLEENNVFGEVTLEDDVPAPPLRMALKVPEQVPVPSQVSTNELTPLEVPKNDSDEDDQSDTETLSDDSDTDTVVFVSKEKDH